MSLNKNVNQTHEKIAELSNDMLVTDNVYLNIRFNKFKIRTVFAQIECVARSGVSGEGTCPKA